MRFEPRDIVCPENDVVKRYTPVTEIFYVYHLQQLAFTRFEWN